MSLVGLRSEQHGLALRCLERAAGGAHASEHVVNAQVNSADGTFGRKPTGEHPDVENLVELIFGHHRVPLTHGPYKSRQIVLISSLAFVERSALSALSDTLLGKG
jgi:hypothetical protein